MIALDMYASPAAVALREKVACETLQTLLSKEAADFAGYAADARRTDLVLTQLVNLSYGLAEAMVRRSFGLPPVEDKAP